MVRTDRVTVRHAGNHVPTHQVRVSCRILESRHCDGSAGYPDLATCRPAVLHTEGETLASHNGVGTKTSTDSTHYRGAWGSYAKSTTQRDAAAIGGESAQQIDQALIRELFLQRLPPSIRMILASTGPDMSLDAQATLADKMMEVSPALHQVHAVEQGQRRSERPERQSDEYPDRKPEQSLKCNMQDLKWQMEELTQLMNSRSRPESRSSNPAPLPRQGSQSGNRPEGTRYPFRNGTCYYHFKFGDKATRCEGPCKMSAGNDQARK